MQSLIQHQDGLSTSNNSPQISWYFALGGNKIKMIPSLPLKTELWHVLTAQCLHTIKIIFLCFRPAGTESWIKTLQWILEIWCWWWWAGLVGRDLTFQLLEKSKLSAVWNMTFSFNKENFWKYFSTKFGLFD